MSDRPIENSYWVVDGSVLAGEYPGNVDRDEAARRLLRFLDMGVSVYIDLTEPDEHGLEPYADLLMELAAERGLSIDHRRHAIVDGSVPTDPSQLIQILDLIDACVAAEKIPYVHCWGGTGRTGVVAGCYYRRMGHDAASALSQLRARWATMAKAPFRPGVPETREQVKYIEAWDEGSDGSRPGGLHGTIHSHFNEYFEHWGITLPSDALTLGRPREIQRAGWRILYCADRDQEGLFLDFYAQHRMTNDCHVRIRETGEIESLPAFPDFIAYPRDATPDEEHEAQRRQEEENERVAQELARKFAGLWGST